MVLNGNGEHNGKSVKFILKPDHYERIFIVEESPEGGFEAKVLGYSIFTEGETMEDLKQNIIEAIHCHFDDDTPKIVRLHMTKEEVFAA